MYSATKLPPSEIAKQRPANYASLNPAEQWEIDKRLGILDWDGTDLFVVRLWDGMDGEWIDVTPQVPWETALQKWNQETANGTARARYQDIDYYAIFPANTRMVYTHGNAMLRES